MQNLTVNEMIDNYLTMWWTTNDGTPYYRSLRAMYRKGLITPTRWKRFYRAVKGLYFVVEFEKAVDYLSGNVYRWNGKHFIKEKKDERM